MTGLNDKQSEACSYVEGPLLILAGAGSGKTRVITHRIAYLIDELAVNPYSILAITFTNKAANEMRERVDKLIDVGSESIWVSTFHSMCVRILRRFYDRIGGKNNFTIYDTDDQKAVIKEVLKNLGMDPKMYPEKACMSYISKAKEEFLTPDDMDKRSGTSYRDMQMANVYREYQKRMVQNNALDFDDLIFKTLELFTRDKEVLDIYQSRFRYIMVDEYQDTNHSQFLLVKMLAAKYRNLCVVGDDDQSIYKFRGADISNILNFEDEYPDAKVIKLEQNYRSTKVILDAANSVIANNEGRKSKKLWTENYSGNKIKYMVFETEYEEAHGVINAILDQRSMGREYSDIAILYRTNAQSRVLEEKLIYANIPYKLVGGTGFYNRKEVRDMIAYLKLIANHSDDISFSRIINVPRRGIGATTVNRIKDNAYASGQSLYDYCKSPDHIDDLGRSGSKICDFINMMDDFTEMSGILGNVPPEDICLTDLYDSIVDKTGYKTALVAEGTDEAKARIENLDELKNKIAHFEQDTDEPGLMGLLEEISLVADTDEGLDTDNKVTLMTLHSAKGLEFPCVYIVGMEERLFPSGLSIDSDDPDAVEEERRLCYVGITRAMEELMLSGATTRMINGTRTYPAESRFIKEIPKEFMERSGVKGRSVVKPAARPAVKPFGSSTFAPGIGGTKPDINNIPGVQKGFSSSGSAVYDYEVGDTVRHIKFGKGTVVSKVKGGSDYEVTVDFEKVGEKKMFASLARLKKV